MSWVTPELSHSNFGRRRNDQDKNLTVPFGYLVRPVHPAGSPDPFAMFGSALPSIQFPGTMLS